MILNILGTIDRNGEIELEVPRVLMDRKYGYKIAVRHLNIELVENVINATLKDNELICLISNVIDMSAINTMQAILHFSFNAKRKSIQNIKDNCLVFYSLHLYDLENMKFKVKRVFNDKPITVKNIFIQLEIIKLDAYGRFQQ